jgi:single-strand DNA-binding protein
MSSRSLNRVTLIGNLTRDPELRYTPQGTPVCTFGLATNRSWQPSAGGERQEETEFHRIVSWNKLAELCNELLFKGRKVYLEGRIQTRSWTDAQGTEKTTTEIVIDNMIVLDNRHRDGGQDRGNDGEYNDAEYTEATPNQAEETVMVEEKTEKTSKKVEAEPSTNDQDEKVNPDDIPF